MKKLIIILIVTGLSVSASAQKVAHGGFRRPSHVAIHVGGAFGPFYPFYSPYYGYPYYPWGAPYAYMGRPSRLELQIQDIRNDYRDKIWSARHDNSLTRIERKKTIHTLKTERDQAISDAQKNYYKRR